MKQKCRKEGIPCEPRLTVFAGFLDALGECPPACMLDRVSEEYGYTVENLKWVKRWHGQTLTSEYVSWSGMVARCEDPGCPAYADYGGRGISVSPELRTFNGFFAVLGPKPSPKHSVDRIDNEKGYAPGNVRWAPKKVQARNTRANRHITFNGRTQLLCEWAEELGIGQLTLSRRIDAYGWTLEEAMTGEKFPAGPPRKLTEEKVREIFFAEGSHSDIGRSFGVFSSHVSRIKSGHAWPHVTRPLLNRP